MDIDAPANDANAKEVVKLWRVWRTVHEMVADRVSPPPVALLRPL